MVRKTQSQQKSQWVNNERFYIVMYILFAVVLYFGPKVSIIHPTDSVTEEVKSVDILAALPTPPHNQNEDIRYNGIIFLRFLYTGRSCC